MNNGSRAFARNACDRPIWKLIATTALTAISLDAHVAMAREAISNGPDEQAATADAEDQGDSGEILVTARRRSESLMRVPVAVTALGETEIERYKANNIAALTETVPTVVISNISVNAGGTLSIRGIGTPGGQAGFEQAVSVAIDGVQTSNARLLALGSFDLQQAEILKGPQALFFGKNSPAGVISLTTQGPTDTLEGYVRGSYEFVGDEAMIEGALSGPLFETLSGRVALRYRTMRGWLYNDAGPYSVDPFEPSLLLPGASDRRMGQRELMGRVSLKFEPSNAFKAVLKLTGARYRDNGGGTSSQSTGPCPNGLPRFFVGGITAEDVYGECRADNHTTNGDWPALIGRSIDRFHGTGEKFGASDTVTSTLNMEYRLAHGTISSTTGYVRWNQRNLFAYDQTSFSQSGTAEQDKTRYFSQELRFLSDFDSPVNIMLGGYYQSTGVDFSQATMLGHAMSTAVPYGQRCYNPATGRFICFQPEADVEGETLSAFGQAIWDVTDQIELAAGLRYTRETKDVVLTQPYGVGPYDISGVVFASSSDKTPGVIAGRIADNNWSPEATLSYHPTASSTLYVAYKTGYKSGGVSLGNPRTAATTFQTNAFGPERVKGFELGAKGRLAGDRLTLQATAFAYTFSDLQVTTFNVAAVSFAVQNAGRLKQKGLELQGDFVASDRLRLRGALAYTDNRFHDFVGQCYGYRYPAGTTRTQLAGAPAGTVPLPPTNCMFATAGSMVVVQDFEGRRPARSPVWSGNAGFTYDQPVGDLTASLSGDAIYSGGYYPGESMAVGSYQPSYWKVNASLRLTGADNAWEAALIGRNLTNEYVVTFSSDRQGGQGYVMSPNEQRGQVLRGREVVLQGTFRF